MNACLCKYPLQLTLLEQCLHLTIPTDVFPTNEYIWHRFLPSQFTQYIGYLVLVLHLIYLYY